MALLAAEGSDVTDKPTAHSSWRPKSMETPPHLTSPLASSLKFIRVQTLNLKLRSREGYAPPTLRYLWDFSDGVKRYRWGTIFNDRSAICSILNCFFVCVLRQQAITGCTAAAKLVHKTKVNESSLDLLPRMDTVCSTAGCGAKQGSWKLKKLFKWHVSSVGWDNWIR